MYICIFCAYLCTLNAYCLHVRLCNYRGRLGQARRAALRLAARAAVQTRRVLWVPSRCAITESCFLAEKMTASEIQVVPETRNVTQSRGPHKNVHRQGFVVRIFQFFINSIKTHRYSLDFSIALAAHKVSVELCRGIGANAQLQRTC